jgi:uncharacterized protein YgbK (DUF1537 family)
MSGRAPSFGWYGDDFTGSTDTLATLARRGIDAVLFLGIPTAEQLAAAGPLDAVGIAGAARAMAPDAMAAELEPVGRFFSDLGVRILQYKCCSTFDSAPHVGSIGAAVAALRPFFPNSFLPIVGGQPGLNRYCLFSTLFASAGTGGAVHRIDRHPTMKSHPVTPMQEADLRLHLAAQGLSDVRALHYPAYAGGVEALQRELAAAIASGSGAVLMDVARDEDLIAIGRMIRSHAEAAPLLAVGASSVGQALADAWPGGARDPRPDPPLAPADGPVFLMVGSLSPVTRRQVAEARSYERVDLDAVALIADAGYGAEMREDICERLAAGRHVIAVTDVPTGAPADAGAVARATAGAVARATAGLTAAVMAQRPVRRLGIAGGDTSSLAAQALPIWALSYVATLSPGVTLCRGHSDDRELDGLELMLKGGQMGAPELFESFARGRQLTPAA